MSTISSQEDHLHHKGRDCRFMTLTQGKSGKPEPSSGWVMALPLSMASTMRMYGEIVIFECGVKGMVQDIRKNEIGCILFGKDDGDRRGKHG